MPIVPTISIEPAAVPADEPDAPSDPEEVSARRADAVDHYVGRRVRALRLAAGMSQEKLGEHLGVTFQQVQKYEKGINRMGASRLYEIAAIFAVPVGALFDGLEQPSGTSIGAIAAPYDQNHGLELLQACARLRPGHRRALLVVARAMLPPVLPHAGARLHDQE